MESHIKWSVALWEHEVYCLCCQLLLKRFVTVFIWTFSEGWERVWYLCVEVSCVLSHEYFLVRLNRCCSGESMHVVLGSCVDWRMRELRVISPRGDSADRTLPGSQLQPLITPSARPSPLWSLTLGEEISRGRHRCGEGGNEAVKGCRDEATLRERSGKGRRSKEGLREKRKWVKRKGGENSNGKSSRYLSFFNLDSSWWGGKMDTNYRLTLSTSRLISLLAPY